MHTKMSYINSNPERGRNSRLGTRVLLLLGILISFATFVYAEDSRYDEQNYSFRAGYTAGYEHGNADQQARANFDFRHDRAEDHYNNNLQQDVNFRLGYVEGYADGYFRQNPMFNFGQQNGSHESYRQGYNQNYGSPNQGGITVFTGTQYQGYARGFGVGQYPSLEGRLDDDIQSVRLNGNVRVILFEDGNFKGKSIIIERDTWDLGNFNKKAGSMIIEPRRY
jgi:hypothetical protein